jgi:hypothetical protein
VRGDYDPRDGACFYQNPNYGGASFCIRAGEELGAMPRNMNDQVSSIRTFGASEVTVYRDQSFRGPSVRFDGDVPDLRPTNWNDRVSSIRVTGDRYGYSGVDDDRDRGFGRHDRYDNDANRMIRRAYRDVLGRNPDSEAMRYYRSRIVEDGWSEAQVRQDLRRNDGYALSGNADRYGAFGTARARAESVVRNAYRAVLGREPDPGSEGYLDRVMHDGWSQSDVERELRRSAEYRNHVR